MHGNRSPAKRATVLVNSMGLGRCVRDLALVKELRRLIPELEIAWLAPHPCGLILEEAGETVHPSSSFLRSASFAAEAAIEPGYRWNGRMAERLLKTIARDNAKIVASALADSPPHLFIADDAPELTFLLQYEPFFRRWSNWSLVFITDSFSIGPRSSIGGGPLGAIWRRLKSARVLRALRDHLAEGDAALFIGTADDIGNARLDRVPGKLRDWFETAFRPIGYPLAFDPKTLTSGKKSDLKARLGYDPEKPLVLASIGATAAAKELLERVDSAAGAMALAIGAPIQLVLVGGPRLPPQKLRLSSGLSSVKPYVPKLYEHFAAADFAITAGGLMSALELATVGTPFVYVPLCGCEEQESDVASRLTRLGAGVRMSFFEITPKRLGEEFARALEGRAATPKIELPPEDARSAAKTIASLITA